MAHIKGKKSHAIIQQGLKILENLDHRGAVGADKLMGDGAGILIQIPDTLYRDEFSQQGIVLPPPGEYGVAMVFLPRKPPRAWPVSKSWNARSGPKARSCWAGATCRWTWTCPCHPPCATANPSSASSSSAVAPTSWCPTRWNASCM